jgi:hypothetical protein
MHQFANHKIYEESNSGGAANESFVITLLNEKKNGYYVELGAFHSKKGNNTWLLEKEFDWTGVSFDIVPEYAEEFNSNRSNPCILHDATTFDFRGYFEENNFPKQIDYLQVDMDAGYDALGNEVGIESSCLKGLVNLPLSTYRFTIIQFEHDCMANYKNTVDRDAQRAILSSYGYKLVQRHHHEDWWVDSTVIPYNVYSKYMLANSV